MFFFFKFAEISEVYYKLATLTPTLQKPLLCYVESICEKPLISGPQSWSANLFPSHTGRRGLGRGGVAEAGGGARVQVSSLTKPGIHACSPLLPVSFHRQQVHLSWPDQLSAPDTTTSLLCELRHQTLPLWYLIYLLC